MAKSMPALEVIRTSAPGRRNKTSSTTKRAGRPSPTEKIVRSITGAIIEHRIMPGTKLPEQKLATIFGVSRTIVRQALNQLSVDRLITLESARGAFVAMPSVEEARDVFQVRAMVESALVSQLARNITRRQIAELRAHLREEDRAISRGDVAGRTRLLGDFHVVLARLSGNSVLESLLHDLVSRSALISLMYQSSRSAANSCNEHVRIVDALESRNVKQASKLMKTHLKNVENDLLLEPPDTDLASALIN